MGEEDHRKEKIIPISAMTSLAVYDEMRYEFEVKTTWRRQPYRFRAMTTDDLTLWVDGLTMLISSSRQLLRS